MNNGFIAYQKGDLQNATYFFETASKTLTKDTASLLNLMYICLDKKDYDKALLYAEKLQANNYHRASIYTLISTIKLHKGNNEEALNSVKDGLNKNINDKSLLLLKSNLELETGKELDAINTIKQIIETTQETHYYATIGVLYENNNMPDSAQLAYEKCLANNATNIESLSSLAFIHFNKGEQINADAYDLPVENIEGFKKLIVKSKEEYMKSKKYADKVAILLPKDESIKDLNFRLERRLNDL